MKKKVWWREFEFHSPNGSYIKFMSNFTTNFNEKWLPINNLHIKSFIVRDLFKDNTFVISKLFSDIEDLTLLQPHKIDVTLRPNQ